MISKVYEKGQIILPVSLRKKYGININSKVEVLEDGDYIKIIPYKKKTIDDIAGMLKLKNNPVLSKEEMSKTVEEGYTTNWNKNEVD